MSLQIRSLPGRSMPLVIALVAALSPSPQSQEQPPAESAAEHHLRGVDFHNARRLDEASREYALALSSDPQRPPAAAELAAIRRFAPRLHTTPTEIFPLRDAAAVMHPTERLIAYHLFWEDDIDFPDDNDPCDHEVVWVQYAADGVSLERVWTYFHGRLLEGGEAALRDARAHGMRPRVNVQWGKHGSMPVGWEAMPIAATTSDIEWQYVTIGAPTTLLEYNRGTWQKLRKEGRRALDHPLARRLRWPERFQGDWSGFIDFSREIDLRPLLDERGMVSVSRWNSAVINQQFLPYNFRPKTEWPTDASSSSRAATTAAAVPETASLEDFQLPSKGVFDRSMPRYPNVWFYVEASLVDTQQAAMRLVADQVRSAMRVRESYGPFSNPEGADFEVTLEHLQPWEAAEHRALQHSHAFHMRYYHSALAAQKLDRVSLRTTSGSRDFYRVAASAHYEVEHTNPNHADVEICPICGRTGEYATRAGNLVEEVHDPLGVELLLNGTIRRVPVQYDDSGQAVGGLLPALERRFAVQHRVFPAQSGDYNTLRIGVVMIGAAR